MKAPTLLMSSCLGLALAAGVVGCAPDRPGDVPATALRMTEGNGRLTFRAPNDGTVYIYDEDDHHMVYSGQVRRGDVVELKPDDDRILLNERRVAEKSLRRGNEHRIYFERDSHSRSDRYD